MDTRRIPEQRRRQRQLQHALLVLPQTHAQAVHTEALGRQPVEAAGRRDARTRRPRSARPVCMSRTPRHRYLVVHDRRRPLAQFDQREGDAVVIGLRSPCPHDSTAAARPGHHATPSTGRAGRTATSIAGATTPSRRHTQGSPCTPARPCRPSSSPRRHRSRGGPRTTDRRRTRRETPRRLPTQRQVRRRRPRQQRRVVSTSRWPSACTSPHEPPSRDSSCRAPCLQECSRASGIRRRRTAIRRAKHFRGNTTGSGPQHKIYLGTRGGSTSAPRKRASFERHHVAGGDGVKVHAVEAAWQLRFVYNANIDALCQSTYVLFALLLFDSTLVITIHSCYIQLCEILMMFSPSLAFTLLCVRWIFDTVLQTIARTEDE